MADSRIPQIPMIGSFAQAQAMQQQNEWRREDEERIRKLAAEQAKRDLYSNLISQGMNIAGSLGLAAIGRDDEPEKKKKKLDEYGNLIS